MTTPSEKMSASTKKLWQLFFLFSVGLSYNAYFGWNWWPSSDAEMICDLLYSILAVQVWNAHV